MPVLHRLSAAITRINCRLADAIAWLVLAMVLLTFSIAIGRYAFGWGWIALQELVVYFHALVFMGCAAAGLARNSHVRVDIFYGRWSDARKARLDRFGDALLLIPFMLFLLAASWNYVLDAWALQEQSPEPGGLPLVYVLKSLILVMALQLLLQGLANLIAPRKT